MVMDELNVTAGAECSDAAFVEDRQDLAATAITAGWGGFMFYGFSAVLNPIPLPDDFDLYPSHPQPPTEIEAQSTR